MRKYERNFNCVMRREGRQIGGVVAYVIGGGGTVGKGLLT